ncbi:hypothetical protein JCM10450v2_008068 [Rhodotorula kratochvilovae]
MAPPPSLLDFLASSLEASVPGSHRYALHVVRSEPQRSHALFPHASNAKTAKVYHEETLVVLSEKRTLPRAAAPQNPQAAQDAAAPGTGADGASGAGKDGDAGATASSTPADPPVASTSNASPPPPADAPAPPPPTTDGETEEHLVPVVALEASLFFVPSSSCALLYISKVDTTGLSSSPISPTRALVSAYIAHHLLHPPHHARRLRVHVFARAQAQYLFPGSADNAPHKRVLDDKALLRWWKGTLERASTHPALATSAAAPAVQRFYLVPGLTLAESLPYVPSAPAGGAEWTYGHANGALSSPLHAPAPPGAYPLTDHVPAFPDDPKARFLHSLTSSPVEPSGAPGDYDDAFRALSSATFSAGTTPAQKAAELERQVDRERRRLLEGVSGGVDEWWERMAFRQECCAGALVGFFVLAAGEPSPLPTSAPPPSPTKPAPPPRRSPTALRPAQYTKLWSTLHNFDYALPALSRLGPAVARWAEGVERAARGTWSEERGGAQDGEGVGEGAWEEVWRREGAREVRIENAVPPPRGEGAQGGEKRPAAAEEPKKVNVLAPRKKKKVAPGPGP